jgi:hypothetical protein
MRLQRIAASPGAEFLSGHHPPRGSGMRLVGFEARTPGRGESLDYFMRSHQLLLYFLRVRERKEKLQ